jgi:hypothetical protein
MLLISDTSYSGEGGFRTSLLITNNLPMLQVPGMDPTLRGHKDLPRVILPGLKSLSIDELMCWLPVVVRLVTVRYPRPDRRAQPKYKKKVLVAMGTQILKNAGDTTAAKNKFPRYQPKCTVLAM